MSQRRRRYSTEQRFRHEVLSVYMPGEAPAVVLLTTQRVSIHFWWFFFGASTKKRTSCSSQIGIIGSLKKHLLIRIRSFSVCYFIDDFFPLLKFILFYLFRKNFKRRQRKLKSQFGGPDKHLNLFSRGIISLSPLFLWNLLIEMLNKHQLEQELL